MLGVAITGIRIKNQSIDMPSPTPDDSLLVIRCPSCGQRFKVEEDLRDRTAECGACEHRFRINGEVIVRVRRFFPSARDNRSLDRFPRISGSGREKVIRAQPIRYSHAPSPLVLEPTSPQRTITGAIGVVAMVLMALLLMFGGGSGGMLDGMVVSHRLLMAGFVSLLGVLMLVYGNPKARVKALAVGLLLSVGLLLVPFFFSAGSLLPRQRTSVARKIPINPTEVPREGVKEDTALVALRNQIGTGPLVSEIDRLAKEKSAKQAVGLWLRGLSDSNRFLVRDYILRVTGADASSHFYPRDGGDYLLVVTGVDKPLPELAELASALGQTEKIYPEISVIEVRVRNEIFVEGSIEKLSKKEDPAFYDLNKRELESIDLERIKRSVQRLAAAEPKIYRSDISRKLISLLGQDGVDFKANICTALAVWSDPPGPASEAALKAVKKLAGANEVVPPEMVALIVKEKNTAVIPILDELWYKNPMAWESLYADLGQTIEATVIHRFPETKGTIRYSAARILGRVGGVDSLPVLAAAASDADPELKVLLEQAQKSIRGRLNP